MIGWGDDHNKDRHIFNTPVQVDVTGYVCLDAIHASASSMLCQSNGGRGIQKNGMSSGVRGLWELHPVLSLEVVE